MLPDSAESAPVSLRRTASAFLGSLALHLTLCLTAVVAWVGQPPARGLGEASSRRVEVVLTNSSAAESQYFQESAEAAVSAAEGTDRLKAELPAADPFPAESAPAASAGLPDLPQLGASALPREDGLFVLGGGGKAGRPRILPGSGDAEILAADAAYRRPAGPTGPTAKMSLFGSGESQGRSFVFVIDRSQSMGSDGLGVLSAAAKELSKSLGDLTAQQSFQVVAYNQQPAYLGSRRLIPASDDNKQRLIQYVSELVAYGATEHYFALSAALQMKPDVIFFLTDGEDPLLNTGQLAEMRNRSGGRTTIHCIQFSTRPAAPSEDHFMRKLAEQNRGSYVYVQVRR